jgi:hypothetical protein
MGSTRLHSDAGLRHGKICGSVLIESPFGEAFADNLQLTIIGIDALHYPRPL